jgi:hypothetical protein
LLKVQPDQDDLPIRQIADEPPQRRRQLLDECGHGEDLVVLGERRLLEDVDDLELIPPIEIFVADLLGVVDGAQRSRRRPGYV